MLQLLQENELLRPDDSLTRIAFARKICACLPFHPSEPDEICFLISQLLRCQQFLISPTGSNVLFEFDRRNFEKKFGLQLTPKVYCG
jgi:hypothetical protein